MQKRKTIPTNIKRKLWAESAAHCQNPNCHKHLFSSENVNISSLAHIIGVGKTGPRSECNLSEYIDLNGYDNLIILCLDCHKIIDTLEYNS